MNRKFLQYALVGVFMFSGAGAALADPIEGMWKRPANKGGTLERIHKCGDSICVTVASGDFNGKRAGKFKAMGDGKYEGTITDLAADKTYVGKAKLNGNVLKMSGCIAKVFCRAENWTRQ